MAKRDDNNSNPSLDLKTVKALPKTLKVKAKAAKKVILSSDESKQLLKHNKIRDRMRDLLSKSTIRYQMQEQNVRPKIQLNIGKRTLMILQKQAAQPKKVSFRDRPVNRFYVSVFLMIILIGASGYYTFKFAGEFYDQVNRTVTENLDWQGWIRNVSGKSTAFQRDMRKSFAEIQEDMRKEKAQRLSARRVRKIEGPREAATEKPKKKSKWEWFSFSKKPAAKKVASKSVSDSVQKNSKQRTKPDLKKLSKAANIKKTEKKSPKTLNKKTISAIPKRKPDVESVRRLP